jgi:hypothetical protein
MRQRLVCSIPGCGRTHDGLGLCEMHRKRLTRTGAIGEPEERRPVAYAGRRCRVRSCSALATHRDRCRRHYYHWLRDDPARPRCAVRTCPRSAEVRSWCGMHYKRWQRSGTVA